MLRILKDIRLWILIFFLVRLIGITNPPLETGHNWRQTLTAMVARNFYQEDANIFYPRIDMRGSRGGIIASEFPFFNYMIFLVSKIFGYDHWYGRLINLIVSSIGIYFFYLLIERLFNQKLAFNAAIILLSSIWFAFSRKIMPDTFSVALVIIGLYFCVQYLLNGRLLSLIWFFLLGALGVLCKIPAVTLLTIIPLAFFIKDISRKRVLYTITMLGLILVVAFLWYYYWVPYLIKTYQVQLYFPRTIMEGLQENLQHFPELLQKFYFSALHSFIAFGVFLLGLWFIIRSPNHYVKFALALLSGVFTIFILKAGYVFPTHNYYIIPFVPVMAFVAGYGVSKIKENYQGWILFVIAVEGIANQQHDFFIKSNQVHPMSLEKIADQYIGRDDQIIIVSDDSPQELYFTNRKGWFIKESDLNKESFISLKAAGAKYLVINKQKFSKDIPNLNEVYTSPYYRIYKL